MKMTTDFSYDTPVFKIQVANDEHHDSNNSPACVYFGDYDRIYLSKAKAAAIAEMLETTDEWDGCPNPEYYVEKLKFGWIEKSEQEAINTETC